MIEPEVQRALQDLKDGRLDSTGTVTTASDGVATTTAVTRQVCSANSLVVMIPTNASAASADGAVWVTPAIGSFTINHSASTLTRTYSYIIFTGRT